MARGTYTRIGRRWWFFLLEAVIFAALSFLIDRLLWWLSHADDVMVLALAAYGVQGVVFAAFMRFSRSWNGKWNAKRREGNQAEGTTR